MLFMLLFLMTAMTGIAALPSQSVTVLMDDSRLSYSAYGQYMSFSTVVSNGIVHYAPATIYCGSWITLANGDGSQVSSVDLVFSGTSITINALLSYLSESNAAVLLDGAIRNHINNYSPHPFDNPFVEECTVSSLTLGDLQDQEHTLSIQVTNNPVILLSFVYTPSSPSASKAPLIGGIVSGVVGGILILVLLTICLRNRRNKSLESQHARGGPGVLDDPDGDGEPDVAPNATLVPSSLPRMSQAGSMVQPSTESVNHYFGTTGPYASRPLPPSPASLPISGITGAPLTMMGGIRSSVQSQSEVLQRLLDQGLPTAELAAAIRMLSSPADVVAPAPSGSTRVRESVSMSPPPPTVNESTPPSYRPKSGGR
ncbi:hypothetical protein FRB93_001980 [Tulasnella sp. JGI-2019a]|nr:hypothetical protein FRB93_001980 [Tulasnella sp. JGI-2019a]